MKKLLIILMLFVLPLQLSWAVAAAYCQHEQGSNVTHFGHHQHMHQVSAEKPKDQKYKGQTHSDCGYCHAVSQVSFLVMPSALILPAAVVHASLLAVTFSSHIPDGPRRPDRHPVV